MWKDEEADPPVLVCQVGGTQLRYQLRAIEDLHAMLKAHGDWMALGGADEQKPAPDGTVEAWGRSPDNPVGGWYGSKKGLRGPLRRLPAAAAGSARPGGAHARGAQQPDARALSYQPPSERRSWWSASPRSNTSSLGSVNVSRNHCESSRPTPLFFAPPNGAIWSQ